MTGALSGQRVLVPRGAGWGEHVAQMLRDRGAIPVIAPLIASAPPLDVGSRERSFDRLASGDYDWVFFTSATAVLLPEITDISPSTRIAAVGAATAEAVRRRGWSVAFQPQGPASAHALVTQWLAAYSERVRVLVVRSDLALSTVSDELELRRHHVDVCIAYRTVGVDLTEDVRTALNTGAIDVVLLTSLSVARELRRQLGVLPPEIRLASIGAGTTHDAEALGFTIDHTAAEPSIAELIAGLDAQHGVHTEENS